MAYIVRAYYGDKIYSIDLSRYSQASIGSGNSDSLHLDAHGLSVGQIKFVKTGNGWMIKAGKGLFRENSRISSENLFVGGTYTVMTNPQIFLAIHPKQADSDRIIKLTTNTELNIGRAPGNDIVFANMRTSSRHCAIYSAGGGYKIKDCGSKNGTFVNGKRIAERILCEGDIINVSVYQIMFEHSTLSFYNVGSDVQFNTYTEERKESVIIDLKEEVKELAAEDMSDAVSEKRSGTFSLFGENDSIGMMRSNPSSVVGGTPDANRSGAEGNTEKKKGTVSVFDF